MKKTLIAYIVVCSSHRDRLSEFIKEWSEDGYELWGTPFVNNEGRGEGLEICQAMVKYE